jgi:hypothetical protein
MTPLMYLRVQSKTCRLNSNPAVPPFIGVMGRYFKCYASALKVLLVLLDDQAISETLRSHRCPEQPVATRSPSTFHHPPKGRNAWPNTMMAVTFCLMLALRCPVNDNEINHASWYRKRHLGWLSIGFRGSGAAPPDFPFPAVQNPPAPSRPSLRFGYIRVPIPPVGFVHQRSSLINHLNKIL